MGSAQGAGAPISRRGALALAALLLVSLVPAFALSRDSGGLARPLAPEVAFAAVDSPCGGAPMPSPDQIITGSFGRAAEGSYVMVPFDVPEGTDAVRVKYCHDQPLLTTVPGTDQVNKHTLDLGLYEPREEGDAVWDADEFRGWGGSSRKDVTLSPEGSIDPDPPPVATQETTVGYRPGPVAAGRWAAELGVAAVGVETSGVEDERVQWRIEVDAIDNPEFSDEPYEPVPYDETPARAQPGWYAGDFHVHARHSAPGDATMRETFDYAFAPLGEGAGMDFITLSDYVTDRAWGEIGAFQEDYPGNLIVRSSEVITYRGHMNNHGGGEFVDYRTGPVRAAELTGPPENRRLSGTQLMRPRRPAADVLDAIHAGGGWTQLNHVETFPSEVPTFGNLCRGCSWEYSDAETDYRKVDAIEVATGPAGLDAGSLDPSPNPFTPLAVRFYEEALDANGPNQNRIAAVAASDSHNAGGADNPLTQAPIGTGHAVVFAEELSEAGIKAGIEEGHSYAKIWGADGPDVRFEGIGPGLDEPVIMGDTVPASSATLTARVLNLDRARAAREGAYNLVVVRDGLPLIAVPLPPGDEFEFEFPAVGAPARYSLWVTRVTTVLSFEVVSTPIWVDPAGDPEDGDSPDPPPEPEPPRRPCSPQTRIDLTPGDDVYHGTPDRDHVHGRRGGDTLVGRGERDCLLGGRGRDDLRGGGRRDYLKGGAGRDEIRGGRGRDRIGARDGCADEVRCGSGRDTAVVDHRDSVLGCERVRRAAAR